MNGYFVFLKNKLVWVFIFIVFSSILLLKSCSIKKDSLNLNMKVESNMDFPNIRKVVLKNGFTVLIFKTTQTPKVLLQIAYDIGSWVEKSGERGLAHLIEHMIFKGTDKFAEGDIDAIARKFGADFNAFTSKDITSYYFEVNKNNWKPFVEILAECMQNAKFDAEHLASEFKAVIQELRMMKDNHFRQMIEIATGNTFPSNHPYHAPVIGYKQDLVNISAQNLKAFYKKYYKPERATLFMVGDIDLDEAENIAVQNFSNLDNGDGISHFDESLSSVFELVSNSTTNNTVLYEDVTQELQGFYWLIPGLNAKGKELVSVVESVIGTGEGSRLYKRLVEKEKVAASVAAFGHQLMHAGLFFIIVEPLKNKSAICKKLIIEELNNIVKNGVEKSEIEKVVNTREREHFQQLQSLQSFTYEWLESFIATKDEYDIFASVNRYAKVSSDKIVEFVKNYLDTFFVNEISVLPLPEDKKSTWQKLKEKSEEMDKLILAKHQRTAPLETPTFVNKVKNPEKLSFEFPKPDKDFTLENGLNVLIHKNQPWPIFSASLRFKQAAFFADSKEGILLDFMMNYLMEGAAGFSKEQNVDFFENLGATYSFDVTGGFVSSLTKNIDSVLSRFADILTKPDFPESEFEKLREILLDLYERRKDSQKDLGLKIFKNLIYKNHPFNWSFDDAIQIIKTVDIKKLKELHKKYVTPQNMILSIVGNFDLDKTENKIRNIFSSWHGEKFLVEEKKSGDFDKNLNVDQFMLRDQVMLIMGRPSNIDIYHDDYVPVKILDFIVFSSLGSRLFQLREQTGLFYTASGMFAAGASRVNGFDYVTSILNLENVEKAENLFKSVIDEIGKDGVLQHELDASKQGYLKDIIDITASNEALAMVYARLKSFDLGFDYYNKVLNQVQSMTLEDINKICTKYFNSKDMCKVRVGRVGKK
ncbi:insulinase family protein [Candidatus Dependentiae bacterium]|nr:insulinase family protein [Candidatus Dependentiae bacterium]MBU4386995.1 insulinase family protein [Candidatus Dependentiae bacterium]MCG2756109.1 insulinase family protein [Candidatus Dependentiae bacterium]